mmetsp:Transcript_27823/g.60617  ORF Transcript_27823/g.60617 Transcript_27823/m.60617 type:complete len:97 (-) Transcript_27823:57-347(-)
MDLQEPLEQGSSAGCLARPSVPRTDLPDGPQAGTHDCRLQTASSSTGGFAQPTNEDRLLHKVDPKDFPTICESLKASSKQSTKFTVARCKRNSHRK